jgi:transcription elongation factor Elf1
MHEGGVLEKSFECFNCQRTRITIQMLPGRTILVTCRLCDQVYEVTGKNGEILVGVDLGGKKRRSTSQSLKLQVVGG